MNQGETGIEAAQRNNYQYGEENKIPAIVCKENNLATLLHGYSASDKYKESE
jgi:hypothetical protein